MNRPAVPWYTGQLACILTGGWAGRVERIILVRWVSFALQKAWDAEIWHSPRNITNTLVCISYSSPMHRNSLQKLRLGLFRLRRPRPPPSPTLGKEACPMCSACGRGLFMQASFCCRWRERAEGTRGGSEGGPAAPPRWPCSCNSTRFPRFTVRRRRLIIGAF